MLAARVRMDGGLRRDAGIVERTRGMHNGDASRMPPCPARVRSRPLGPSVSSRVSHNGRADWQRMSRRGPGFHRGGGCSRWTRSARSGSAATISGSRPLGGNRAAPPCAMRSMITISAWTSFLGDRFAKDDEEFWSPDHLAESGLVKSRLSETVSFVAEEEGEARGYVRGTSHRNGLGTLEVIGVGPDRFAKGVGALLTKEAESRTDRQRDYTVAQRVSQAGGRRAWRGRVLMFGGISWRIRADHGRGYCIVEYANRLFPEITDTITEDLDPPVSRITGAYATSAGFAHYVERFSPRTSSPYPPQNAWPCSWLSSYSSRQRNSSVRRRATVPAWSGSAARFAISWGSFSRSKS